MAIIKENRPTSCVYPVYYYLHVFHSIVCLRTNPITELSIIPNIKQRQKQRRNIRNIALPQYSKRVTPYKKQQEENS